MDVTIRNIVEADYPVVADFIKELHQFHAQRRPDLFLPEGFAYDREKEFLPSLRGGVALMALVGETPAGVCLGTLRDRDDGVLGQYKECHITDLVVSPAFRRQGIAKALMAEAEKRAKALGAERIDLTVWRFNDDARALYEGLGYENIWSWMEKRL